MTLLPVINSRIDSVTKVKFPCVTENAHATIYQGDYNRRYNALEERFEKAKIRLEDINDTVQKVNNLARKNEQEKPEFLTYPLIILIGA